MAVKAPPIITCPEWGARRPTGKIQAAGRPTLIVEHHTAGHAPTYTDVAGDQRAQAIRYARDLQHLHQVVNGWIDSGHSFLVMRSGLIVQGRWGTVTAIEHGRMVISAHCPGQNDQPGIEHEHAVGEQMTELQYTATTWLQAWICDRTGIRPTELYPHRRFYATDCPDNLTADIPRIRQGVAARLTAGGPAHRGRRSLLLARAVNRTP